MGLAAGSDAAGLPGLGDLVIGVDHVGLAVGDLDAAVDFHSRVLGFHVTHRETNLDQQTSEVMLAAPGARPGDTQLQLLAPTRPGSAIAKFLDRRGPGIQQLALRVRDVNLACDLLRTNGVRLLYDSPRLGTGGSRINFVHPQDAGGVLIELVELPVSDPTGDRAAPTERDTEGDTP